MKYKYFKSYEFKRVVPYCTLEQMDVNFMTKLDNARHIAGIPFRINSAYRSEEYEKERRRSGTSSHTKGLAVDIRCNNSSNRLIIIKALLNVGFNRIGVYSNFIHVDDDLTKVQCLFLG